jgi:ComEC/Rec2-related protein
MLYSKSLSDLEIGDSIALSEINFVQPKNELCAWHYTRKGILAGAFCEVIPYKLVNRPCYHIGRWIHHVRNRIWQSLNQEMSPITFSLFSSLFGGNKDIDQYQARRVRTSFKTWGLSHYLARSGAHLVIFACLWLVFLRAIPCSLLFKHILLVIILLMYSFLTWPSLSFDRALCMTLMVQITQLFQHSTTSLHVLCLVTLFTLISNPFHLFFLDFQLSFGFSYALIWLAHITHQANNLPTHAKHVYHDPKEC